MRKGRVFAYICIFMLFSIPFWGAQHIISSPNLFLLPGDSITIPAAANDSASTDSTFAADSLSTNNQLPNDSTTQKKAPLDAIVEYHSNDSLVMTQGNWAYLFGSSEVLYDQIKLNGEVISINMDSSIVEAKFGLDSIGDEFGYPIFSDGGTEYETKTMKYNFKTKKGFSHHLVTEQGEGYVVAVNTKMNEDKSFFLKGGKYTTCDQHEHPHFYLALTKAKVQPGKNVVAGPAYLVIEDLHIPFIGLPFGFFPFSDKYSSGVIMPSYGDEMDRGFNLHDGGYYFAFNDYFDMRLTGTIFTKGSWALNGQSTYRKRYKFNGNVNIGYQVSKYGDKDIPGDYSETKDLRIAWSHSQDPKANMFRTFTANVNFSTQSYDRNNLDNGYAPISTTNTKSSSISFSQRFPNSPWSITGSTNINQTSSTKAMNITLPSMVVSMSRVFPFKREDAVGSEKWFEKIQISYTGDFRNSISTTEDNLSLGLKNWNNGMQHSIPVSATFSLFDHLNITPSVQYKERWYTRKYSYKIVDGSPRTTDEDRGLYRVYDFSASLGFQTKLYGFYTPVFSKSTQIRHVFTPSISLNYTPDFGDSSWGYWETLYGYDTGKKLKKEYYVSPYTSTYSSAMFGVPGRGAQGTINFNFQNNLEMKMPWESDSLGYKKISLIDNLGLNLSYNTQAEAFRWSDPAVNLRLKLSKSLTVNLNATYDLYTYDFADDTQKTLERVDKLRIGQKGKGIARLRQTGYSISPSINQDTFNKLFGRDEKTKERKSDEAQEGHGDDEERKSHLSDSSKDSSGEYDSDGYLINSINWNLGFSYSMNYAYNTSEFDRITKEYKRKLTHSLSFNGSLQPTKNWGFNFYGSYDFETKKIPHMSCSLTRNLHCWSISASFTPVGPYKSYYVSLRASSSILQDLKHEFKGRKGSYDPTWD